jgi:hypothetical protein
VYTIPTRRGDAFFLLGYGLALVILLAGTMGTLPVPALGPGAALGAVSGVAHVLAVAQLPRELNNASTELAARRRFFLASTAGKLHFGLELLVSLLLAVSVIWRLPDLPLTAFLAYWTARFAVCLLSQLLGAARLRQG